MSETTSQPNHKAELAARVKAEMQGFPNVPEYGATDIKLEVNAAVMATKEVLARVFDNSPENAQLKPTDRLLMVNALREKLITTRQQWEERAEQIRALNLEINEEKAHLETAPLRKDKLQKTLVVENAVGRAVLRAFRIPALSEGEHLLQTMLANVDDGLRPGIIEELKKQRDALGSMPLPEHIAAMNWLITKLHDVAVSLRPAAQQSKANAEQRITRPVTT